MELRIVAFFKENRGVETFAKPPDVDAVQGVAAQRAQTYQVDRQASEQRTTQKCAADGGFAKVSGWVTGVAKGKGRLKSCFSDGLLFGKVI